MAGHLCFHRRDTSAAEDGERAIESIRKAVFPVAGLGTRFLQAPKAMPTGMLTVVDKPLI